MEDKIFWLDGFNGAAKGGAYYRSGIAVDIETFEEKFGLKSEIDKMDKIMDAIEKYDLESKYKKIIITDMGTFNAAKNKWQKRKRELKYGVQELPKAAE